MLTINHLKMLYAIILLVFTSMIAVTLSNNNLANANSFFNNSKNTPLEKNTVFVSKINAEGGALNTILITKESGDGPIKLEKAFLFVENGLKEGNVHLHNIKLDGRTMVHFNAGEVTFVKAGDTNSNDIKFRGNELTKIIKELVNSDELSFWANETIEFDFMAAGTNDPIPTPVGLMINVKSDSDATVKVEIVE